MTGLRLRVARWARSLPVLRRYPATYVTSGRDAARMHADFASVRAYVLFVGQPRTGHSLVGALLDAHPHALIAHELDALKYVAAGYDRDRLYSLLVRAERARVAAGHRSGAGYQYLVPGEWQGRYTQLEVIGDKKGGRSTLRLADDMALLDRLHDTVGVDVHVVQVVRNPYDVIATIQRRGPKRTLPDVVDLFFKMADTAADVRDRVASDRFHEMHYEELIADPQPNLAALCGFVQLPAPADYLDACASIVFDTPRRTRSDIPWTAALLEQVATRAANHPELARYEFEETTA